MVPCERTSRKLMYFPVLDLCFEQVSDLPILHAQVVGTSVLVDAISAIDSFLEVCVFVVVRSHITNPRWQLR